MSPNRNNFNWHPCSLRYDSRVDPLNLGLSLSPLHKSSEKSWDTTCRIMQGSGINRQGWDSSPTAQWVTSSSRYLQQMTFNNDPAVLTSSLGPRSSTRSHDVTIVGSSRSSRAPNDPAAVSLSQLQGILRKDLEPTPKPQMFETFQDVGNPETTMTSMTLRERLHKNKATLRSLLSEENNPLNKIRQRQVIQADINRSLEADIHRSIEDDIKRSLEADMMRMGQTLQERFTQNRNNPSNTRSGNESTSVLTIVTDHENDYGPSGLRHTNDLDPMGLHEQQPAMAAGGQERHEVFHIGQQQQQVSPIQYISSIRISDPAETSNDQGQPSQEHSQGHAKDNQHHLLQGHEPQDQGHHQLNQRSLADWPGRKHVGNKKRYVSPDSSHDSAVDVDTTSLQSSPGSSTDTRLTVISSKNPSNHHLRRQLSSGNKRTITAGSLRHGRLVENQGNHVGTAMATGAVGANVNEGQQPEVPTGNAGYYDDDGHHLPLHINVVGDTHNNRGDSDVDSGIIAQSVGRSGVYLSPQHLVFHAERRDSSSSTELDPELDDNRLHTNHATRLQHSRRSHSSQELRISHTQRRRQKHSASPSPSITSSSKHTTQHLGPLRADHAIQATQQLDHTTRAETPSDHNVQQHHLVVTGPRYSGLSVSMQDLRTNGHGQDTKRASPIINRVRFEDEVSDTDENYLPSRSTSHQDLRVMSPKSRNSTTSKQQQQHGSTRVHIPPGCRALKLKAGRSRNSQKTDFTYHHFNHDHPEDIISSDGGDISRSEVARILGLPPSGKAEDLKLKLQRLRTRTSTPTEVIHAAANDPRLPITTGSVHRATPVFITDDGSHQSHGKDEGHYSEPDRYSEVSQSSGGFTDAWTNAVAAQNSKSNNTPEVPPRGRLRSSRSSKSSNTNSKDADTTSNRLGHGVNRQGNSTDRSGHGVNRQGSSTNRPGHGVNRQGNSTDRSGHDVNKPGSSTNRPGHGVNRPRNSTDRPGNCGAQLADGSNSSDRRKTRTRASRNRQRVENPYEDMSSDTDNQRPTTHREVVHVHHHGDQGNGDAIYAVPQKPRERSRARAKSPASSNPCMVTSYDDNIYQEATPPVPHRGYTSDLERYRELSGSRTSLSEKMGSFRKAAKSKFSALRRAVSLERIDHTGSEASNYTGGGVNSGLSRLKKSPSLQNIAVKFSLKRKNRGKAKFAEDYQGGARLPPPSPMRSGPLGRLRKKSTSMTSLSGAHVDGPTNVRSIGRLRKLYSDGTQLLELVRPPHGPFGFYIARGNANYGGGIFVSRLSDGLPEHFFSGLLGVGDELLEINDKPVAKLTLDEVYSLMSDNRQLNIKTLPYMARKDIS